jgi:hypothetical protein
VNAGDAGVLLTVTLLVLIVYVLAIWTLVDAARRPDWQFRASGQSKVLWIVLPIVGMLVCQFVAIVAFVIYLTSVRPRLEQARLRATSRTDGLGPRAGPPPTPPTPPTPPPPPPPSSEPPPSEPPSFG